MAKTTRKSKASSAKLSWDQRTELVGIKLLLQPQEDFTVPPHYTTELHSWLLDQVRRMDFELSSYLHDGQSEKPFTVSNLSSNMTSHNRPLRDPRKGAQTLSANQQYEWTITLLSQSVIQWAQQWLQTPPTEIRLRSGVLNIVDWQFALPATTYAQLLKSSEQEPILTLSFLTPTSFRRKGNHLPLPLPFNLFHSYLRRWNDFSGDAVDQDDFLDWLDEGTVILRHHLQTAKVSAGKSGSVTGFIGSVQLGLTAKAKQEPDFVQQWLALGQLAPYCGTGHKTTFGLGQTRLGWQDEPTPVPVTPLQSIVTQRIQELTELFIAQRKRTGGDRAIQISETWATILARREVGESLQAIAEDLQMPYETAKTYSKLARKALRE
ncbi:MAG: CRISPR-associated endoribonuclease Cas6 [Oscillatoriales cyanobacterium C42_A2020_001]|nr:CRISPR-associated endoribonuclease Cas6 [Leptolyngbyaceae cyanobacterium C42_A2020_001]